MTETATVRVELDTSQAKASLREMTKQAQTTGSRVGDRIRGAIGRGVVAAGIGGIAGAAVSTVRSATSSGISDIVNDAIDSFGAKLEGPAADAWVHSKATHRARQEFIQNYGPAVRNNGMPPGLLEIFQQRVNLLTAEEQGKRTLRAELPTGLGNLIEKLWGQLTDAVVDAVKATIRDIF